MVEREADDGYAEDDVVVADAEVFHDCELKACLLANVLKKCQ